MEETMFYLTIVVEELILKHSCCYVDNFYNAIKEINKDYLKSEEYRKDVGLLDSVNDYVKNNRRLILYIMNREQVTNDEII
jgi:lipoprotein NlpI